jgi:hypothetical protein
VDAFDSLFCCYQPLLVANQLLQSSDKTIRTFSDADAKLVIVK